MSLLNYILTAQASCLEYDNYFLECFSSFPVGVLQTASESHKNARGCLFLFLSSFLLKLHIPGVSGTTSQGWPSTMAIQVVEFSNGGYKIRKIFASESTYPKEIINFKILIFASYWGSPSPILKIQKFPLGMLILRQKSF